MPDIAVASPGVVRVRFFAAAREAAGQAETSVSGATLSDVVAALGGNQNLVDVLSRSTFLVDGTRRALGDPTPLPAGATVDVLPPFAGG